MRRYQVLENDRPADCFNFSVDKSWNKSTFDTYDEALKYAKNWLGFSFDDNIVLHLNEPYDYSGYGDKIEIRKVE